MKKILIIFAFIFLTITLTSCGMFSPSDSLNDKYCDNYPNDTGCKSNSEPTGVLDESPNPDDPDDPDPEDPDPDDSDDPFRKYDDGVIEYNYDEMTWVRDGYRTYYINEDTGVLHGMYFGTLNGDVVDDEIIQILYYWEGEEIRFIQYYEYPYIEEEERFFDTWTREYYYYFDDYSYVSEYYKSELIDEEWMQVEKIKYWENGTLYSTANYSFQAWNSKAYDENGMVIYESVMAYPYYSSYSYFEDGSLKEKLVGYINTDNFTYDKFVDEHFHHPRYFVFTEGVYEKYSSPGILNESAVYGVMTQTVREYDIDGVLSFEKESFHEDYNTFKYSYSRYYIDGVFSYETCSDNFTFFYCEEE